VEDSARACKQIVGIVCEGSGEGLIKRPDAHILQPLSLPPPQPLSLPPPQPLSLPPPQPLFLLLSLPLHSQPWTSIGQAFRKVFEESEN